MSQSPPQSERVVTLFLGGDKHGGQGAGGGRKARFRTMHDGPVGRDRAGLRLWSG